MIFLLVRILSVLSFLLSSLTYNFSISGYLQLNMTYITGVSQTAEYEEMVRQTMYTCGAHVAVRFGIRIPVLRYRMAGITESAMVAYTHKYAVV